MKVNLSVEIGGIWLKNPVLVAAGTFGYGEEYRELVDLNRLGGLVTKVVTLHPRDGNPPPRLVETPAGLLNSIGMANVGVGRFIEEKLPFLASLDTTVIVNVAGDTVDEYVEVVSRLDGQEGIAGLEVNISCPNVERGGLVFGSDPWLAFEVVSRVRRATRLPFMVKLSPSVTDITRIARRVEEAGADAISLVNTLVGMAVDVETRRPRLARVVGGLSGPAIKPVALALVWKAAQAVKIPVVGIGGITTSQDALEFLIAGARAVQVGTANFVDPETGLHIVEGIERYCWEKGIERVEDLVGSLIIPDME